MKKYSLKAALIFAAALSNLTNAGAQTLHVVGASATSQFLTAAIGSDQLALTEIANNVANGTWSAGQKSPYHWTAKNSAHFLDNRDTLGRILPQTGNVFIIWIADSSDSTGNTNVTDIWAAESV